MGWVVAGALLAMAAAFLLLAMRAMAERETASRRIQELEEHVVLQSEQLEREITDREYLEGSVAKLKTQLEQRDNALRGVVAAVRVLPADLIVEVPE